MFTALVQLCVTKLLEEMKCALYNVVINIVTLLNLFNMNGVVFPLVPGEYETAVLTHRLVILCLSFQRMLRKKC